MTSRLEIPPDLETRAEKREYIRAAIDFHGFRWLVWEVSASGFFTDSYNLFATNVILPMLAFVYWPLETNAWRESLINIVTLVGSVIGQLLFGVLADWLGRTRLYGVELAVVIVSTITVCAASEGVDKSISILGWLVSMRFVMGIGIGAEYPLSAAICTEWASTRARARMMSAVFLMQPLGQLAAHLVGLCVVIGYNRDGSLQNCFAPSRPDDIPPCRSQVDSIWRWVTGVGAIPALVAIYYRFRIKDPGLYDLDVRDNGDRGVANTVRVYRPIPNDEWIEMRQNGVANRQTPSRTDSLPVQMTLPDIKEYFWNQGNWRFLAGTSICWFLLDVAFYGLGIGNPKTLAKLWAYYPSGSTVPSTTTYTWNPDLPQPNPSIYDALFANAKQSLLTVCIASVSGSVLLVWLIDYIPRKQFLVFSFVSLVALFFVTGGTFFSVFLTHNHAVSIVLVALCHFMFSFGANTLTFIIPAELFPTSYRASCHGIAAATGKIGSIVVQGILSTMSFNGKPVSAPDSNGLGWVFIIFGFVMALGALFAWVWIPALQDVRTQNEGFALPNKTLEVLSQGVRLARDEGQIIGMRDNFTAAFGRLRKGWTNLRE